MKRDNRGGDDHALRRDGYRTATPAVGIEKYRECAQAAEEYEPRDSRHRLGQPKRQDARDSYRSTRQAQPLVRGEPQARKSRPILHTNMSVRDSSGLTS